MMPATASALDAPASSFAPMHTQRRDIPLVVQILSTLLFGAFAIVAVVMAFNAFWPAGAAIAIVLAWRGGFAPHSARAVSVDEIVAQLRMLSPEAETRRSGNASFDAYRADVLNRLEEEQTRFDAFLGRLREAKDKSEFDRFMDQRAYEGERSSGEDRETETRSLR